MDGIAWNERNMYFCQKTTHMPAFTISVAEYRYYFNVIKEYFGLTQWKMARFFDEVEINPNLVDDEDFRKNTEIVVSEHIPFEEIESLLDKSQFNIDGNKGVLSTLIFFVANIYYGYNYYIYLKALDESDYAIDGIRYSSIREETLNLFIAIKDYEKAVSWALVHRNEWERTWKENHKEKRALRKKAIIKELETEYGEIKGNDWKEREAKYSEIADERLDVEMDIEMKAEKEWLSLNSNLTENESIRIKFGKQKPITLFNYDRWFKNLMSNHVFPRFIPDIASVSGAKNALKKPSGRPKEDIRVRTIAYGFSQYLLDQEVIDTKTSRNLLRFLEKLFQKMNIRCNDGKNPTQEKIEDVIQNAEISKERPRFYTQSDHWMPSSWSSWEDPSESDILNWLETPEVIFKHKSK